MTNVSHIVLRAVAARPGQSVPGRAEPKLRIVGASDELFNGQSIPQDSWMMPDEA